MANKDIKKCLTSLVIREIKTTISYYCISTRMAIIDKIDKIKYWQICEETGHWILINC